MKSYTKPYKDIQQQLSLLESRGMDINDRSLSAQTLNTISYYRLSAYWYPFRIPITNDAGKFIGREDNFEPETALKDVVQLYIFDKKLRLLLWDAIERIEIDFRTKISLSIGKRGATAHRNKDKLHTYFTTRKNKQNVVYYDAWISRLKKCEERSSDEFVKHFNRTYTGNLPIWMSIELWDFGLLSTFYKGMQQNDKEEIAKQFGLNHPKFLENWMWTISVVRNICAHHGRLWNRFMANEITVPKDESTPQFSHIVNDKMAKERLYSTLIVLIHLTKTTTPNTQWHVRLKELCQNFPTSDYTSLKSAGFPDNWETQDIWQ